MIRLAIVCPCYNEEAVLEESARTLNGVLDALSEAGKVSPESFMLFVNDGSRDGTWDLISGLHAGNPSRIKGLSLAHNVGHQYAIMAGMMQARTCSDAVVTIDADLQDEVSCIEKMVDAHQGGAEVVYGVKVQRTADPLLKRMSAEMFYRLQESMGTEVVFNHADFRFLSRKVLDALSEYGERNLYLRGLIPLIGYPSATVEDHIRQRQAGCSKYTLSRMLSLALDGVTSFSVRPLYWVMLTGVAFVFISLLIAVYVVYSLLAGTAVPGWSSLMLSVWFVGGVILMAIGLAGIYIGKIYGEVKHRPLYHVSEYLS